MLCLRRHYLIDNYTSHVSCIVASSTELQVRHAIAAYDIEIKIEVLSGDEMLLQ